MPPNVDGKPLSSPFVLSRSLEIETWVSESSRCKRKFLQGHPTSLLSPDWPGATRIALEEEYGGICVFVLGACGETMPIEGHQGNPLVTERQGRQVGLAACSALSSLPSEGGVQLQYSGPIISGAVIGQWLPAPFSAEAVAAASAFRSKEIEVSVPMRPMQSAASAAAVLKAAEARLAAAQVPTLSCPRYILAFLLSLV